MQLAGLLGTPKRKTKAKTPAKPARVNPTAAPTPRKVSIDKVQLTHKPEADSDAWGTDGLTHRQRLFVEHYFAAAGGNATKAAELAGYASDNRVALASTAYENLRKPQVQRAMAAKAAKLQQGPEFATNRLVELAQSTMANFLSPGPARADGTPGDLQLDLDKAAAMGALGQLREYKEERVDLGDDSPGILVKRTVKIHDPLPAVALLMKFHGLIVERSQMTLNAPAIEGDMPDEEMLYLYLISKRPKESWIPGIRTRYERGLIQPRKMIASQASTLAPALTQGAGA